MEKLSNSFITYMHYNAFLLKKKILPDNKHETEVSWEGMNQTAYKRKKKKQSFKRKHYQAEKMRDSMDTKDI
jgi:hypothetical protein